MHVYSGIENDHYVWEQCTYFLLLLTTEKLAYNQKRSVKRSIFGNYDARCYYFKFVYDE